MSPIDLVYKRISLWIKRKKNYAEKIYDREIGEISGNKSAQPKRYIAHVKAIYRLRVSTVPNRERHGMR